jgi:AcrR family transcriptional regulator
MELWSTSGWRGTSIAAVAERAGVTDQGLLHHFGTKQNLLFEVVAEQDRRSVARLADMFESGGLATLRRIPDMARVSQELPELDKLFVVLQAENLDSTGPAHEYFVARERFTLELWANVVRTGQARGELRPDVDPELVALQINAFMDGAHTRRHLNPDIVDMVALYEDFADRLIRDLTSHTQDRRGVPQGSE